MPNVSLEPATAEVTLDDLFRDIKRGLFVEGRGVSSIDQQRYNFQFGGAVIREITNGKLGAMVRDAAYQSRTPDFWASCDGLGGPATGTMREIKTVVFACDAGMGSSAMGASVLRNKIKKAGIEDVTVTNKAIAALDDSADLVITQNQLTDRARHQTPDAVHISVDNFMNSPRYDEVVELIADQKEDR